MASKYAGLQGDFSLQIAQFAEQTKEAIDASVREIVIELGNSLIRMSPVDTGRFRGNWQFTIGSPATDTVADYATSAGEASARLTADAILFKAGETAYIVNNLPYAIPLEYGHSDQAPGGMVRMTLARFQKSVEDAIRNNKV